MKHLALITLAVFVSNHALAADKLTEETIREFYDRANEAVLNAAEEREEFYKKHLHKNFDAKIEVSTCVDGEEPIKMLMVYDKKTLISETASSLKEIETSVSKTNILSISANNESKTANVKYKHISKSKILQPQLTEIEQLAICNDILNLSNSGVIQIKSSVCETDIKVIATE